MRLELRAAALERGKGADGDQFALGVGQVVAGEDVAEEMRLKIIVGSGGEVVVEWAAGELRLHLGALLQGVVAGRQRVGVAALGVIEAALLAPVEHALQGAQGVKAARKAGVGVELREGFLDLAYGESGVETALDGGRQTLNVALSLKA